METPDLGALRELVDRGNGADRAFVDAMLRMRWAREASARDAIQAVHDRLRPAAAQAHAKLRDDIAREKLRGRALRRHFDDVPSSERDHFVEEVLGIAYPPLEESVLEPELITYCPSSYDEIVHALDTTHLGAGDRFLDIGSGMGKSVMLATLLTEASSSGIECEAPLHELATRSARELALDVHLRQGDARESPLDEAEIVFMYLPFTGSVLATVMNRILEKERRFVCAGALDLRLYPTLEEAAPSKSWLHIYAVGTTTTTTSS